MASAIIYMCDKCESYINDKEVHRVDMIIRPEQNGRGTNHIYSIDPTTKRPYQAVMLTRKVCPTCAERLIEDLKLDKTDKQIDEAAFQNFSLPNPIA